MTIPQFTAGQVLTAAQLNAMVDAINLGGAMRVEKFAASGTWTVPAGVTYAVAHIRAGGGGVSTGAGTGGTSSVAFAGGTVSATGGEPMTQAALANAPTTTAGAANSGNGANALNAGASYVLQAQDGAYIVAGDAVTPAATITVTVGAGGTAGTSGAAGGSGYVWIEYQV
jgi:hypothetical protein